MHGSKCWGDSGDIFLSLSIEFCLARKCDYHHYSDLIMSAIGSEITGVLIICLIVCPGTDQRKQQSSALLAFVRGIHRWPVNSPHKGPVMREIFPFDDVIMIIFIMVFTVNVIFFFHEACLLQQICYQHCASWLLMVWSFSTKASVAAVSMHPCKSSCLWVKETQI